MRSTRQLATAEQPLRRFFLIMLVLAAAIASTALLPVQPAEATHFRSTQLTWKQVSGNTVEFHHTLGARRTFYSGTDTDGRPKVGDTIRLPNIIHGDGTQRSPNDGTVIMVDKTNDWLIAESTYQKTYAHAGPFNVVSSECCRLSGPAHRNNPDGNSRVETIVSLAAASASPESLISPIVDCPTSGVCSFTVPAIGPSGLALTYRLATPLEASGSTTGFRQPGPPQAPNAAGIDAATGQYSWDTTGASLNASGDSYYSTQVMVEGRVDGNVVTKTAVDFFIRLTDSANQAPVFDAPTPADGTVLSATVGSPMTFDVAASDPDMGDTVTLGMLGKPAAATYSTTAGNPASGAFSWTPSSTGSVILTLTAQDQHGRGAVQRSVTINVTAPSVTVDAGDDVSGNEGSPISLDGTVSGASSSTWSYTAGSGVDAGATCSFGDASAVDTTITCTDDGTFTVTLTADGVSDSAEVTVANVAPALGAINAPADPVAVNTPVEIDASFTDPGANDTHTCEVDWDAAGSGIPAAGVVDAAAGECSASHTYTTPGIYTLAMTVTDDDGGADSAVHEYVVVYDPSAGFVTGGGWIDSPAGAYTADPDAAGKANFGFVSKYKKGATRPDGNTQFQFKAGNLNFHSTSYDWLVVSGPKAQYKGSGTINGAGDYAFLLTANDGQVNGGGGTDRFRIKIWDKTTGDVVYDNQSGDGDDASASDAIEGGSIVIHTGKT